MTFADRRNVVTTAIGLVNTAIPYPSTFLQIPVWIVYYGSNFDGTIADISNLRCDGFVEYAYEKNNFRVWRNQDYVDTAWSIVLYPDLNNDRPDLSRNPEDEASPWAQRGAPCATGPNTSLGCSYLAPDTKMTSPAIINLPTYQVTTNGGPGYLDVTIQAADASGIHLIAVIKPGEASWTYSPTQPQHPTSVSYSWTTRITNTGTLYYAAIDNGGNAPTLPQTPSVTLVVPPISPPSPPTASAATSVTSSGFTANWNSANGAPGYRLDVSTSSSFASYVSGCQNLDAGNVNHRSVTGLAANTIHYYRVRAYKSGGTSGNSGTINVTTLPNPPAAPTANAATSVTASSFTANWSTASGATGYRLDVSVDNAFSSFVSGHQDLNVGNVTTKSVTGLNPGAIFYYRFRGIQHRQNKWQLKHNHGASHACRSNCKRSNRHHQLRVHGKLE